MSMQKRHAGIDAAKFQFEDWHRRMPSRFASHLLTRSNNHDKVCLRAHPILDGFSAFMGRGAFGTRSDRNRSNFTGY